MQFIYTSSSFFKKVVFHYAPKSIKKFTSHFKLGKKGRTIQLMALKQFPFEKKRLLSRTIKSRCIKDLYKQTKTKQKSKQVLKENTE